MWKVALALLAMQSASPALQTASSAPPPTPTWSDDRPITRFLQNLTHDLRGLPSPVSAITLAVGGGSALALHAADEEVQRWAAATAAPSYTKLGSGLGSIWVEGAGAFSTYAIGKLGHNAKLTHIGSDLIRSQALNGLITYGLKVSVDRTRPDGGHYSFPSGHSGAAFTSAAVLQGHFGWKAGVSAYAAAGFVGWTRIRDQQHWLSDVAMGATIGTIVGHTIIRGHRARVWQLTPVASQRSMAVYIVRN